MTLANTIASYAEEAANSEDWAKVVSILTTPSIPWRDTTLRTAAESFEAVASSGANVSDIVVAAENSPLGKVLIASLAARGVDWASPVPQLLLSQLVADGVPQSAVDVLTALNSKLIPPHAGTLTEADVQQAWDLYKLAQEWSTLQNESINPAAAIGRAELIAALRSAATALEGG